MADIAGGTGQLHRWRAERPRGPVHQRLQRGVLHLAPVSADWVSMTTAEQAWQSALSGTRGYPVEMEVSYRLPYTGYVRVLAGSLSAPAPAASVRSPDFFPTINVAVTQQTAGKFGLKVGSAVRTFGPAASVVRVARDPSPVTLKVAAIVAESQPASSFWEADPSLAVPDLNVPGKSPPYWTSGVFALPDESAAVQQDYGPALPERAVGAARERRRAAGRPGAGAGRGAAENRHGRAAADRPAGDRRDRGNGQHGHAADSTVRAPRSSTPPPRSTRCCGCCT